MIIVAVQKAWLPASSVTQISIETGLLAKSVQSNVRLVLVTSLENENIKLLFGQLSNAPELKSDAHNKVDPELGKVIIGFVVGQTGVGGTASTTVNE